MSLPPSPISLATVPEANVRGRNQAALKEISGLEVFGVLQDVDAEAFHDVLFDLPDAFAREVELGAGLLMTWADQDLTAGAIQLAYRPGLGQTRVSLVLAGGSLEDRAALRIETTAQIVANPFARSGVTVSGGAGVALLAVSGSSGDGYLLLLLGLEGPAARRWGWFAEGGIGGGVRLAAGVRLRAARRARAPGAP